MMKRVVAGMWMVGCVAALWLVAPGSASAQTIRRVEPRQSIGFNVGYFALRGEDSREDGDVLLANLPSLAFDMSDFNFATFGGEWTFGINDYLEGSLGAGFYQRTVPSVYWNVTHENDAEIAQELKLRVVPLDGDGEVPAARAFDGTALHWRRRRSLQLALQRSR